MLSLNTNISDLILQRTLLESTVGLNEAINRMTTGLKVNHAKDNAAGFSIIEDLNTRISSMLQVQQNTEDGISLLSTAEGGLEEIQGLLERLRELTIQASTDTYDTKTRASMQAEADAILEEINRLKNTIQYDGMNLYETPANNNPAARLAQAARISLTSDTGDIISNDTFTLNPVSLINAEDEQSSSSVSFNSSEGDFLTHPLLAGEGRGEVENGENTISSSQPSLSREGAMSRTMMRSASPASTTIDGAVDFASGETKTVTIDGVNYEVKNDNTTTNTLSYSKDTTTGQITFMGNRFTITGQSDVAHNLLIDGSENKIYGGELADIISCDSSSNNNYYYGLDGDDEFNLTGNQKHYVYGGDGNDIIQNLDGNRMVLYAYGESGEDTFNIRHQNGNVDGGDDNDTFNIIYSHDTAIIGGSGNDVFNITKAQNTTFIGNDGNDTFMLSAGSKNTINGGSGVNQILSDNATNTTKLNVEGSNAYAIEFLANETIYGVDINGIKYDIKNDANSAKTFIYTIDNSGQIEFKTAEFTIKGELGKAHNVKLTSHRLKFYGGDLDDRIESSSMWGIIDGGAGNDTIIASSDYMTIYGGVGNDKLEIKGSNFKKIDAGEGEDEIIVSKNRNIIESGSGNDKITITGTNNGVYNSSGEDTINNQGANNMFLGFSEEIDNVNVVKIAPISRVTEVINGKEYTFINNKTYENLVCYTVDETTGQINFLTHELSINADVNSEHNLILSGSYYTFTGGDLDDYIYLVDAVAVTANGGDGNDYLECNNNCTSSNLKGNYGNDTLIVNKNSNTIDAGNGDDTIYINASTTSSIKGGEGDDIYYLNNAAQPTDDSGNNIYYINTNNANVSGGSGNDTFYVTGSNNTVKGAGGDDYFVVDGDTNTIDGGTGNNYYVINGTGNSTTNSELDPYSGQIIFSSTGETTTREIGGKTYTFTNNGVANNILSYSVNRNTGTITLTGSDLDITGLNTQSHILSIRGDNNIVNGGNLGDKITIEQGTNNTINGNSGDDTIINDSENNTIYGGAGNDTITLNKSTNLEVNGGADNDTINVSSSNNTQVLAGTGNDKITVSGTNNNIEAQSGNNIINITSASNTINADDGDNKVVISSNDNEVTLGDGNNTFGISGSNNTVASMHTVGNLNINGNENTVVLGNVVQTYAVCDSNAFNGNITVNGNDNVILQEEGNNSVTIKGSGNEYTSNSGTKDITATGNGNTINTTDGDDVLNIKGNSNTYTTTGGNNTLEIKGDSNQVVTGAGEDKVKLTGSSNTVMGGDGNDEFTLVSGTNNTIDGEGGDRNTIINFANSTNYSNLYDITPRPFELNLKVGIGYDDSSVINTSISFNPIFLEVDLSSRESALESLASIDDCLKSVNEQLLSIGAVINRLQLVLDEQSIKLENMISSRSTLRDADLAEESSNYIKYQILQQASSNLMTMSRGLRQENVLGLLYGLK